jgi:hypothetical protein
MHNKTAAMAGDMVEAEAAALAAVRVGVEACVDVVVCEDESNGVADGTAAAADVTADEWGGVPVYADPWIYAVSDSSGFVGAFASFADARSMVIKKYPSISFVVQRFPVDPAVDFERVWVVLYSTIDAVAYVSNNRARAERVKTALGRIGLTYEDDIKYWEQRMNVINETKAFQLESQLSAHRLYAGDLVGTELKKQLALDALDMDRIIAKLDGAAASDLQHIVALADCIVSSDTGEPIDAAEYAEVVAEINEAEALLEGAEADGKISAPPQSADNTPPLQSEAVD